MTKSDLRELAAALAALKEKFNTMCEMLFAKIGTKHRPNSRCAVAIWIKNEQARDALYLFACHFNRVCEKLSDRARRSFAFRYGALPA